MERILMRVGGLSGALAVLLSAFGAHALEWRIPHDLLETWQLAGDYHLVHALAIVAAALAAARWPDSPWPPRAAWAFLGGTIFFSGSLYALAITGVRYLGLITPIGGILFVVGWILLALSAR